MLFVAIHTIVLFPLLS